MNNFTPGTALPGFLRFVEATRVERYAAASGDNNPIHLDAEYAAATRFGERVAHGMLSLAFVWEMLGVAMEWDLAGVSVKVRFTSPVLLEERVHVGGEVKSVANGRATCDVHVTRPNGERALAGTAVLPIPTRMRIPGR